MNPKVSVASIRATLQALQTQLSQPGLPREAVEDVKRAVDDLGLRVGANQRELLELLDLTRHLTTRLTNRARGTG